MRHVEETGNFTRWQASGLMLYQQSEGVQPCWLSEGREGLNGRFTFHTSRIIDIPCDDQVTTGGDLDPERETEPSANLTP